jgi:hypothetical protein
MKGKQTVNICNSLGAILEKNFVPFELKVEGSFAVIQCVVMLLPKS